MCNQGSLCPHENCNPGGDVRELQQEKKELASSAGVVCLAAVVFQLDFQMAELRELCLQNAGSNINKGAKAQTQETFWSSRWHHLFCSEIVFRLFLLKTHPVILYQKPLGSDMFWNSDFLQTVKGEGSSHTIY